MSYRTENGLTLWPLLPDWGRGVSETLEFRTRIIGPTLTGLRQKRKMRIAPRRSFTFDVHPHNGGRRLLENLRFAQGANEWALPIWRDRQRTEVFLPAGSKAIPCEVSGYDFVVGGYAVLRENKLNSTIFEIVKIQRLASGRIFLEKETDKNWPEGSYLYPIRLARISDNSTSASWLTGNVSSHQVTMQISEPCDWADSPRFLPFYQNNIVLELNPDWGKQRNFDIGRIIQTVDNDTSVPSYFDFSNVAFPGVDVSWQATNRLTSSNMREMLYYLAGRYRSVWVATMADDLRPVSANVSNRTLEVEYCGYTEFNQNRPGRRDIRIEPYSGRVFYARIIGSSDNGGTETLNLDNFSPSAENASNIKRVSFMSLMQQASDNITINHVTDVASTVSMVFEGVSEVPYDPIET